MGLSDSVGVTLTYGPRGWDQPRATFLRLHDRLAAAYAGTPGFGSSDEARDAVFVLFVVGDQLRDWARGAWAEVNGDRLSTIMSQVSIRQLDALQLANDLREAWEAWQAPRRRVTSWRPSVSLPSRHVRGSQPTFADAALADVSKCDGGHCSR